MLLLSASSYGQVTYTIHKKCYYRKAKPGKTYTTYHRYHWHTSYEAEPRRRHYSFIKTKKPPVITTGSFLVNPTFS
jgi:hypothetical protein